MSANGRLPTLVKSEGNDHLLWCFPALTPGAVGEEHVIAGCSKTCVGNWLDCSIMYSISFSPPGIPINNQFEQTAIQELVELRLLILGWSDGCSRPGSIHSSKEKPLEHKRFIYVPYANDTVQSFSVNADASMAQIKQ